MLSEWTKLTLFLEQYDPQAKIKEKRIIKLGEKKIIRVYLNELCKAEYLKKMDNGSYTVVKKVSSLNSIANIMFEKEQQLHV